MKRPQWITIAVALFLIAGIYLFGKTVPSKKSGKQTAVSPPVTPKPVSADTFLALAKAKLNPGQINRLNVLENSLSGESSTSNSGEDEQAANDRQLHVYHQLASFWYDSANAFEPYAWYTAEAARLENSEKTLTFAARLFLGNLQDDEVIERRRWKALQAKDLFERSLKINPDNDSSKVGLGASYLFGDISATPMEGILKIREVVERDSTNIYAQLMLVKGSMISGQYDKAIGRLQTITRLEPDNIEGILLLADVYERKTDKANAIYWYKKSLQYIKLEDARKEIGKRIEELGK